MQQVRRYVFAVVLAVGVATLPGDARGTEPGRPPSPTELEAVSRDLDRRVIELQHDILAARRSGDRAALERAEAEFKTTQQQRIQTLRALGQLP